MANAGLDQNSRQTLTAMSSANDGTIVQLWADPTTHRLLVDSAVASGTVTSITQGTGILLTPSPITTTGSVALSTALQPIATLAGNSLKVLRVNAGETAVEYATASTNLTVGTTTIASGTTTRILYDNAGVLGEYSVIPVALGGTNATSASITAFNNITGYTAAGATGTTSTNLVFSTSPVLTTPTLGVATATSINKVAFTAPATGSTLVIADGKTFTANSSTTIAGTDGKTLTVSNSGTLGGGDAFVLAIAASKTFTVSNTITLAGTDAQTYTFPTTSATLARTDAANTFTGVQTMTSPVLTTPSLGAATATSITSSGENVLLTGSNTRLVVPTGDLTATGFINNDFNSGYSSSAIGDLVYLDSAATWQKTDANTLALYNGLLGIALEVKASGNALRVALPGSFVYSTTGFPTWTIGSPIYMSETAGAMTHTQPVTTDAAIRIVGWGVHADKMYFFPSPDYITHT